MLVVSKALPGTGTSSLRRAQSAASPPLQCPAQLRLPSPQEHRRLPRPCTAQGPPRATAMGPALPRTFCPLVMPGRGLAAPTSSAAASSLSPVGLIHLRHPQGLGLVPALAPQHRSLMGPVPALAPQHQ